MSPSMFTLVAVLSLVVLVRADSKIAGSGTKDSKTASKRGVRGLTGVPGVLYSQYSPHVHTVPVPQPFPVPVPHPVPVQVPRPFPVTVHKPVGLPVPVGVPVPVHVPVPKPYPVPVPVNLPQGTTGLGYGAYGGYGASPFGHPGEYPGVFPSSPGLSEYAGRLGYGLGVYSSPGTPSLPMAHSGLAAALASLASAPLAHPGLPPSQLDPLGPHPPKY